jgi:hypothetical protein
LDVRGLPLKERCEWHADTTGEPIIENYASSFHRAARRTWPTARIKGDGPFAVATCCGFIPLVHLYGQEAEAAAAYAVLQDGGCDTACARVHLFVQLGIEATRPRPISRTEPLTCNFSVGLTGFEPATP